MCVAEPPGVNAKKIIHKAAGFVPENRAYLTRLFSHLRKFFGGGNVSYQAIYRRWRPKTFDDVVGQEHITKTLKNQIINGSTAHAYLFCGTRGTGKTSTAKILARAVNCLNPQNGNPCNECSVCKGLLDESILDVTELDGASKNKVENIRDIIDDVMFLPSVAKKKVYIIDEVHMVTQQAFNALLKTLEEPPAHVMFILATTELNKVPITVLSRCQQFDFRRIKNKDIADKMKSIMEADGYSAEDDALSLIAELGDGSMRDSLSILDKCVGAIEKNLTLEDVTKIVGIADNDALYEISKAIALGDTKSVLEMFSEVIEKGKEAGLFADRLTKYLRDVLVIKITNNTDEFLNTSVENKNKIEELSNEFSKERLLRGIDLLCTASAQARYSGFPRTVFEMALVKMCEPEIEDTKEALIDRISALEEKVKRGVAVKTLERAETEKPKVTEKPVAIPKEEEIPEVKSKEETKNTNANEKPATTGGDAVSRWPEIINHIRSNGGLPIFPHLAAVKVKMSGGKLCLIFGDSAAVSKTVVSRPANLKLIEDAVEKITGEKIQAACVTQKEIGEDNSDPLRELEELSRTHSEIQFI